jgi:predicted permease
VVVGGGRPADALQFLAVQPVLWAALLGLTVNFLQLPLPGSVAAVAAALGPANKPLMLLSAGMLLQPQLPQVRQVGGEMLLLHWGCWARRVFQEGEQASLCCLRVLEF